MRPVSERQERWGGGNNIIFLTILLKPHFREAEAFKLFGGGVVTFPGHDVLV